ncbi:uncharacterized protein DNG_00670 [Cephalotrichum gorgonifer]|uniref:BHLH domain-containing protein n=1 Tax=Cephalotrichum gorgonifer TaxID=2041049 RepID=A0AAE8MQQ1_9PEZI|nr:uncharacterized protein DNG_00670 [Cephalotrichum gorgonifer]
MPRPVLPPTPASSTDIKGKDGTRDLPDLQMSLELPPPALASPPTESKFHAAPASGGPDYPMQASETVKSRRRSCATNAGKEAKGFELPPPPTRSRKIIQMIPKKQAVEAVEEAPSGARGSGSAGKAAAGSGSGSGATPAAPASGSAAGKKKQPSATSAAGRKVARKTAHSLIERRRRSKMNEEFAVLKDMIPACEGEMHKLAILQASIEYVRYLEDCVSKLKARQDEDDAKRGGHRCSHSPAHTPTAQEVFAPSPQVDVEMAESTAPSPTYSVAPSSHQSSVSPAILAQDRRESYSSVSADPRRYSFTTSATPSPACGPQQHYGVGTTLPPIFSALTSPALGPRDADHEATAALLMLNKDRREYLAQQAGEEGTAGEANPRARGSGRGMSVRDLLTTTSYVISSTTAMASSPYEYSPPYSPPPESPITPHPPGSPITHEILPTSKPDLITLDTAFTAIRSPSESGQESESARTSDKCDGEEGPQRPRGGRRRRRGGRRERQRARDRASGNHLGTITDVEDVTVEGGESSINITAPESRFGAEESRLKSPFGSEEERRINSEERRFGSAPDASGERSVPPPIVGGQGDRRAIKKTIGDPVPIPRSSRDNGTATLKIGLDLDAELELKAKLVGDISLSLVVEDAKPRPRSPELRESASRTPAPIAHSCSTPSTISSYLPSIFSSASSAPPSPHTACTAPSCTHASPDLQADGSGVVDNELFRMKIGKLRLRQKWIEREVSPSLTAAAVCAIALAGFLVGVSATRVWDGTLSWRICNTMCEPPTATTPP